jgi:hypothetical protein
MYIEFSLPNGSAGQAAAHSLLIIRKELVTWSEKYAIKCTEKLIKYTYRVTFELDDQYSFFAMTWNPDKKFHVLSRWRIVSDLNNKTSFDSVL